ncbi:hypothetical protein C5167_007783 [Papaver somniferum]|nr:hypothetical protein C5167_007783 [Papaver somniferum]
MHHHVKTGSSGASQPLPKLLYTSTWEGSGSSIFSQRLPGTANRVLTTQSLKIMIWSTDGPKVVRKR